MPAGVMGIDRHRLQPQRLIAKLTGDIDGAPGNRLGFAAVEAVNPLLAVAYRGSVVATGRSSITESGRRSIEA
jgi:hypothetical protein